MTRSRASSSEGLAGTEGGGSADVAAPLGKLMLLRPLVVVEFTDARRRRTVDARQDPSSAGGVGHVDDGVTGTREASRLPRRLLTSSGMSEW